MQPSNSFVGPLLTDLYQLTMAYSYWKSGKHDIPSVFDLHFRKNPFRGEFAIFAGLEEAIRLIANFRFSQDDIDYLKEAKFFGESPDEGFFDWLLSLDCSQVKIYAIAEGTLVFPREPLIRVEGPLAVAQLLETPLLNLVNYPTLLATNAARFRLAAGYDKMLMEFGLRRAQGPDGGVSASRYSYLGGFDATSNVLAGKLFGIPVKGTNAHSFVTSFQGIDEIKHREIQDPQGKTHDFVDLVLQFRKEMQLETTHEGELAAFISYALTYPKNFLALVDTYDTLESGVPNFILVALALAKLGYKPLGIRLDSGDLAYLSQEAKKLFLQARSKYLFLPSLSIVASNDINEEILLSLNQQDHEIDSFGIGTHLVTCQAQPALGGVYKLVELDNKPRLKLSQDFGKVTIPGRKEVYRLVGKEGRPLLDLIIQVGAKKPEAGERILCRHIFKAANRIYAVPSKIVPLHDCYWDGKSAKAFPSIQEKREYVLQQLKSFRPDHLRHLNPTPYKISLDDNMFEFFHKSWQEEAPIGEIY